MCVVVSADAQEVLLARPDQTVIHTGELWRRLTVDSGARRETGPSWRGPQWKGSPGHWPAGGSTYPTWLYVAVSGCTWVGLFVLLLSRFTDYSH